MTHDKILIQLAKFKRSWWRRVVENIFQTKELKANEERISIFIGKNKQRENHTHRRLFDSSHTPFSKELSAGFSEYLPSSCVTMVRQERKPKNHYFITLRPRLIPRWPVDGPLYSPSRAVGYGVHVWGRASTGSYSPLKEAMAIYLGWSMALPLSQPLDVQLGRRASGAADHESEVPIIMCI